MQLDIRTPIGLMFTVLGALLTVWGLASASDVELYKRSLGINVNLWWGLIQLAFGLFMLYLVYRSGKVAQGPGGAQPASVKDA